MPDEQPMRERILAAAVEVFGDRGVTGATTKEIARTAGVSEGSLYNHFANKQDLYAATFGAVSSGIRGVLSELTGRVGQGTVEENLAWFVAAETRFYGELLPIIGPVLANRDLLNWLRTDRPERSHGPLYGNAGLIGYLEAEQRVGRIVAHARPAVLAVALLGACQQHAFVTRIAGPEAVTRLAQLDADVDIFARDTVGTILAGWLPEPSGPAG